MAVIATLGTHYLSYRIALRDPQQRLHVLEETGHGWLGWVWPAIVVAGFALLASAVLGARTRRSHRLDAVKVYLAAAGSFLAVELAERWTHLDGLNAAAENLLTWQSGVPVLLGLLILAVASPLMVRIEETVRERIADALERIIHLVTETTATRPRFEEPALNEAFLSSVSGRGPPVVRLHMTTTSN